MFCYTPMWVAHGSETLIRFNRNQQFKKIKYIKLALKRNFKKCFLHDTSDGEESTRHS